MSDHSTANASGNANNLPDVAATSGNNASSSSNDKDKVCAGHENKE